MASSDWTALRVMREFGALSVNTRDPACLVPKPTDDEIRLAVFAMLVGICFCNQKEGLMSCDCESTAFDDWCYLRHCKHCGEGWLGLHCPHDGVQQPCPFCHRRPEPEIVLDCLQFSGHEKGDRSQ